jgi:hypothetical protein
MTSEWPVLEKLMHRGDFAGVTKALRGLTPAERTLLVAPLTEFERRERQTAEPLVKFNYEGMFTLAGAGILPTAATLAQWIARHGWGGLVGDTGSWFEHDVAGLAFDLLSAREVPWSGDLAQRLARARVLGPVDVRFIAELCARAGIDLPVTDSLAHAWAEDNRRTVPAEIDPRWDPLLSRLFDIADAGRYLEVEDELGLGRAVVTFVAEGRLDRADIVDRCVGALQRGGRLGDVRGYLAVYEALRLTLPEAVPRVRDYLPLLADGHSVAAGMAQRELFRIDDAGQLDVGVFLEASRAVFLRSEKKLVRAQLDRMRRVLDRSPEPVVDDALPVVALAFHHEASDLRKRALDLTVDHAARASARTREQLAAAAEGLPADHRSVAVAAFGGTGRAPAPVLADLPPAPPRDPFPPRIDSLAELAAEVAAVDVAMLSDGLVDPVAFERVLAGVVELSCLDRAAFALALRTVSHLPADQDGDVDWDRHGDWITERGALSLALLVAGLPTVATSATPFPDPATFTGGRRWSQVLDQLCGRSAAWAGERQGILRLRLREMSIGVFHAPRPMLVATPTGMTGLLDPEVLLARLTTAAAEGWEPWPHDLTQAFLRLPTDCDDSLADRAAALGTAAGVRLAHWLADDPEQRITDLLPALAGPHGGFGHLPQLMLCWPMVLPAHRGLVAQQAAGQILTDGSGTLLRALAETDGPVGTPLLDALAVGCAARRPADRVATVDALLVLAARGQLDGAALGRRAAQLALDTSSLQLNRFLSSLRDMAVGGAATPAWDALAAMLPPLLDPAAVRPKQGLADLVALGVELAEQLAPATEIPYLAELAARPGSSRLVTEAGRLVAALPS